MLNYSKLTKLLLFVSLWAMQSFAYAQLDIEGSGADERPYALGLPLITGDESTQSGTLQSILIDDFLLSGVIKPISTGKEADINKLNIVSWLGQGAEFLVVGEIVVLGDGGGFRKEARMRIFDVVRSVELKGVQVTYDSRQTAIIAHQIADVVIERITGSKIGLSQLIAFVVHNANGYDIRVSDILGKNSHSIIRSRNPITSPTWSPDGHKIAYSSFEDGPPKVFIQEIATGKRIVIPSKFQSATAPAWSHDGKNIAFSAYTRGRTSLFEYNLDSGKIRSLVRDGAINTEPSYSPDGGLYYTSSRGSSPQIYRLDLSSLQSKRVSFDEKYCTRASAAKSKPILSYLCMQGRKATINNLATNNITNINLPSNADGIAISPYGKLILLSVANGRNFNIIITNIAGSFVKTVDIHEYNYYEPSWRP